MHLTPVSNVTSYWHPVLRSNELTSRPRAAMIDGERIVVFRGESGSLGALADECAHRRAPLSCGKVEGDRLVCPYHRWSYSCDGAGRSPIDPAVRPRVAAYEVADHAGAIWVRRRGAESGPLPVLDVHGCVRGPVVRMRARAPLELVLDNMSEVEHSPSTHALLAYDPDGIAQTTSTTEQLEGGVRVTNHGPYRKGPLSWLARQVLGIRAGDWFLGRATIQAAPPTIHVETYWTEGASRTPRTPSIEASVFLTPIQGRDVAFDRRETDLTMYIFTPPRFLPLGPLLGSFMAAFLRFEVWLDIRVLESFSNKDPDPRGMVLGRFDRSLRRMRELLATEYYERTASQERRVDDDRS